MRHDDSTYQTVAGQLTGLSAVPAPQPDSEYYLPLAGVHAFMTVGKALTFSQKRMDSLRTAMHARIRRMVCRRRVRPLGRVREQLAPHVLACSKDNFLQMRGMPKYTVTSEAGRWKPTPPAYMDAVEPNWAKLRPFVMDSASQFRPRPPHRFDMTEGSPFYLQVKEVFETGNHLTDEQRAIAAFWDCNPYVMNVRGHAMFATKKITPGGHWMGIVGLASHKSHASLMQSVGSLHAHRAGSGGRIHQRVGREISQ